MTSYIPPLPTPHQSATPPLIVEIGLKEVYDQLVALNTTVQAMNTALQLQGRELHDLAQSSQDHEARLRALERSRWPLPAASLLIALAALVWQAITGHK